MFVAANFHSLLSLPCLVRVYIDPTIVLTSTKTDDAIIDKLGLTAKGSISEGGQSKKTAVGSVPLLIEVGDQFMFPFLLEVRPPGEFLYEAAKSKLVNLKLGDKHESHINFIVPDDAFGDPENVGDSGSGQQGKLLHLAALVNLESFLTVSSQTCPFPQ